VYGFSAPSAPAPEPTPVAAVVPSVVTFQQVKDSWPEILERVQKAKRTAWMVVYTATPLALRDGNILDLAFVSQTDVDALKQRTTPGEGISDFLKQAVYDVLGFRPLLTARAEVARAEAARAEAAPTQSARVQEPVGLTRAAEPSAPPTAARPPVADEPPTAQDAQEPPEPTEPDIEPPVPSGVTWETAVITDAEPETKRRPETKRAPEPVVTKADKPAVPVAAETAAPKREAPVALANGKQRYGESVVREILGASFIEEQTVAPRVAPREQ